MPERAYMRGAILAAAIAALLAGASVRAQTYEQQRDWCVNGTDPSSKKRAPPEWGSKSRQIG